MNILITIDDNYVNAALDMMYSLRIYNDNLVFHVMYDNLSEESIDKLKDFVGNNSLGELKLYPFNSSELNLKVFKNRYITKTCYFRLLAPYLMEDLDRILYLDPDIVCQNNLEELYNIDLGKNIIAACPNMLREEVLFLKELMLKALKLPQETEYINSGVLLIDVKKYIEFLPLEKLSKFLTTHSKHLEYQDQDTINLLFFQKILILDNKYNYQINAVDWWKLNFEQVLIHYSEAKKPWRDDYYDPLRARPYYRLLHAKGEDAKLKNLMYSQALNAASDTYSKIINEEI